MRKVKTRITSLTHGTIFERLSTDSGHEFSFTVGDINMILVIENNHDKIVVKSDKEIHLEKQDGGTYIVVAD